MFLIMKNHENPRRNWTSNNLGEHDENSAGQHGRESL